MLFVCPSLVGGFYIHIGHTAAYRLWTWCTIPPAVAQFSVCNMLDGEVISSHYINLLDQFSPQSSRIELMSFKEMVFSSLKILITNYKIKPKKSYPELVQFGSIYSLIFQICSSEMRICTECKQRPNSLRMSRDWPTLGWTLAWKQIQLNRKVEHPRKCLGENMLNVKENRMRKVNISSLVLAIVDLFQSSW